MNNQDLLTLGIYIGSSMVIGFLVKQWILPYLIKLASRTKWKYDDILIDSIKGWIIFWFLLAGIALATQDIDEVR